MAGGIDFSRLVPASPAEAIAAGIAPGLERPPVAVSDPVAAVSAPPVPEAVTPAPAPLAAPVSVPAPAPAPVPAKEPPRFVGGALRYMEVPLAFPVEFDGVVWETIPLRRATAAEVRAYFEELARIGPDEWRHFPIYARADGTPVPPEVIDHLDPDDLDLVTEASADFLCARLHRLREVQRASSIPASRDNTGPTSST